MLFLVYSNSAFGDSLDVVYLSGHNNCSGVSQLHKLYLLTKYNYYELSGKTLIISSK